MNSDLKSSVDVVGEAWKESPYYADAEQWTFIFWDKNRGFREYFDRLDLSSVVELACGHGRHSERVALLATHLTLMDIHEGNLEACRRRLARFPGIEYVKIEGFDYQPLRDASVSSVFCYDAMVHFSPDLVASYLKDTGRILAPGGMALFHHSNHDSGVDRHYGQNPHARNRMTMADFRAHAQAGGLEVVESKTMDWGGIAALDGLTLLRKP